MIVLKELNPHNYPTSDEIAKNLNILLERINKIRSAWNKPMVVTSGLRSDADQQRINPKAPKSNHLMGNACDISDPDGSLAKWTHENESLLAQVGLWCEDTNSTKGWVHFQSRPYGSWKEGKSRFFIP